MATAEGDNNYSVGAGKVYFDPFLPGTKTPSGGARYLGNTTALTRSKSTDKLDHYGSDYAVRRKDASITLQEDDTGSFTTDNVDLDNVALWFGGSKSTDAQVAATGLTETFADVKLGRWFKLGKTVERPYGARKAAAIASLKVGSTTVDTDDYTVDLDRARVFIKYEAESVNEGDDVIVAYSLAADTRTVVISNGTVLEGELSFIADNRAGDNNDYHWPDVKLSPNGDYALKGETWQELQFNVEFLKKDEQTEVEYIVGASQAA